MNSDDFSYELPSNFSTRVEQFLTQYNKRVVSDALKNCQVEYEDQGLAFYAGLRGDNWDKHAIDFNIEGSERNIELLQKYDDLLKAVLGKALKSNESGLLVRNIFYLVSDEVKVVMPVSNEERLNADIESANRVLKDLIWIGERACSNISYNYSCSENTINDYFRDMFLSRGYDEAKDQTRHGISLSKKDAGEVDILLTQQGVEIALFEGMKLSNVDSSYIDKHIKKAIDNYNALGTATFVVAYVKSADYSKLWEKYVAYIQNYNYEVIVKKPIEVLVHPNAVTRIAFAVFSRDDFDFPVYFITFKIE